MSTVTLEQDIELDQGSDYKFNVQWTIGGLPVDISAWHARFVAVDRSGSTTPVIDLRIGTGITLTDPTHGIMQIVIPGRSTLGVTWISLYYSLVLWQGTASAPTAMKTLLEGRLDLTPHPAVPV